MQEALDAYTAKLEAGNATDQTLFSLGWTVEELKHLNEDGQKLLVELKVIQDLVSDPDTDLVGRNIPRRLTTFREKLAIFVKSVTRQ